MNSEQFYNTEGSSDDITYYEEQLLLNYDDYMDAFQAKLTAINHHNLDLEENLEDDFDSEYDENDWEEEESVNSVNRIR